MCDLPASPTESEPWVFYRGAEYLLAKQPFDWSSVSLACQMMGAYLLSIHSREELHFIKQRLQRVSRCQCSEAYGRISLPHALMFSVIMFFCPPLYLDH